MRFDMHCHTKEGSLDAKARLSEMALNLKSKGFAGMLVTDHNSYKGYEKYMAMHEKMARELEDFVVLKGVEYDTVNAGHMLVILPDHIQCKLLEIRGMSIEKLERLVHRLGGILGPAHPYGNGFFAAMNTRYMQKNKEWIGKFDFIETFNSCTREIANKKAELLAKIYDKPQFAGSDAHHLNVLGSAFTEFQEKITCNNDLIRIVKHKADTVHGGKAYEVLQKKERIVLKYLGIIGYWIYNKLGAILYANARWRERRKFK